MRTPIVVFRQIKAALKSKGIQASCTSCNYQIKVKADGSQSARDIAQGVYHQEKHAWLIVWVDNHILPMPGAQSD